MENLLKNLYSYRRRVNMELRRKVKIFRNFDVWNAADGCRGVFFQISE